MRVNKNTVKVSEKIVCILRLLTRFLDFHSKRLNFCSKRRNSK
jgi:hypothetical protein